MSDDDLKMLPTEAEVADLIQTCIAIGPLTGVERDRADRVDNVARRLAFQRDALLAENERLRGLLKKHEWSAVDFGYEPGDFWHCCPECGASKEHDGRHEPGCAWAVALTP